MWTRREQHQAYRFLSRRIVSTMLAGEPEGTEVPMRRFTVTLLASVGVALLVFAGFAVYGLLFPGGARPEENVIIVERESGAKYVYLANELHPVLNWTSARLILGQASPAVRTMSQASLRDLPRGRPVGIPGAPDALPDRRSLVTLPWSVCTAPRSASSVALATHVFVTGYPAGGVELGANEGVLVTAGATPDRYLIWRDHRLKVVDSATVAALGWAGIRPAPVAVAFLDALPAGPDVAPLSVPGAGQRANRAIAGSAATIGQLFRAAGQDYVMLREGLAPVGGLSARLLIAGGARITDVTAAEVGSALLTTPAEPPGLPADVPAVHGADDRFAMACAVYRGGAELERPVTVESFARVVDGMALADAPTADEGADGVPLADRIVVPGGRGALVSPIGSTTTYLITDQGIKFPLPRVDGLPVPNALGYADVRPVAVPTSILALLPTGPSLDPRVAALFAAAPTVAPTPTR
jgi:type VII secretion protein EccB